MNYQEAIAKVSILRAEVVGLVGICGPDTHPLTELLEALERRDPNVNPDDAVAQATEIRGRARDIW